MKLLHLLILLLLITSCMETRDRRVSSSTSSSTNLTSNAQVDTSFRDDTTDSSTSVTVSDDATNVTVPDEISQCNWSSDGTRNFSYTSNHLGAYNICRGKTNDMDVYLQLKTPPSIQLCLVPVYDSSSKVIYIGEPRCITPTLSTAIYKIGLLKNRSGYSSFSMTGVIMMRDELYRFSSPYPLQGMMVPDAYLYCANYLDLYNDSRYCVVFDQAGRFVYHKF